MNAVPLRTRRSGAVMKVLISAGSSLGVLLTLAACSPADAGREEVPPPSTRVVSEGTSPLESDPAVHAARRGDLGVALARATGDFTLPAFVRTVEPGYRNAVLRGLESQIGFDAVRVPIGPAVWLPHEVGEPDDAYRPKLGSGGVQVDGCLASGEWFATSDHEPKLDLTYGQRVSYLLSSDGDELMLFDIVGGSGACDATGAPVIEFDPALTVPSPLTEDSLVLPEPEG